MSREQILRYTHALYPYLQSELFIRWSASAWGWCLSPKTDV